MKPCRLRLRGHPAPISFSATMLGSCPRGIEVTKAISQVKPALLTRTH